MPGALLRFDKANLTLHKTHHFIVVNHSHNRGHNLLYKFVHKPVRAKDFRADIGPVKKRRK